MTVSLFRTCTLLVVVALSAPHAHATRKAPEPAHHLLTTTGVTGGLAVVVGCGGGPLLTALGAQKGLLVQGLALTSAEAQRARRRIRARGLEGKVTVRLLDGRRLPYVDNLVTLLVQQQPGAVPAAEVNRVLRPGGVACVNRAHSVRQPVWTTTVKPWPPGIDPWSHYLHGADNNAVAHDTVVAPPRFIQWLALPAWIRSHHKLASVSAVVSANARLFYIVDKGPDADLSVPGKWFLVARDAFNGVLLWQRALSSWAYWGWRFRSGPVQLPRTLVAVGERVYAPLGTNAPVCALAAATGETVRTYPETEGAEEILWHNGTLLVVTGRPLPEQAMFGPRRRGKGTYPNAKAITAFHAATGMPLWRWHEPDTSRLMPLTLAAGKGRVFFQAGAQVVCLDEATGAERWRVTPRPSPSPAPSPEEKKRKPRRTGRGPGWSLATLVVQDEVVLWAEGGRLTALAAADGRKLWERPCPAGFRSPADVFVIDGLVWHGQRFTEGLDLHTGEVKRTNRVTQALWTVGHHHRCYREKATTRYILTGKRGIEFLDLKDGAHVRNNWIRGVCQYGIMPCNGLVYAPPHACGCFMEAKLYGFWAVAGRRRRPETPTPAGSRLVRGPAYGSPALPEPSADDWPTYRHDPLRSGATDMELPATFKPAWATSLGGRLTQPVIADGLVVVAEVNRGEIIALDARTGKRRWTYAAGARIDSSPTLHRGRVLFGNADGWVTCLRAADGALCWRFQAATADLQTVVREELESVWPVSGSVLVQNGVAYVCAGRSSYLDGGIRLFGLDPVTGRQLYTATYHTPSARAHAQPNGQSQLHEFVQNATDYKTFTAPDHSDAFSMAGTTADVLVGDGRSVFVRTLRFNRECVPQPTKSRHLFSTSSLLDGAENHRSHWVLGTGDFRRLSVAYSWIANSFRGAYGMRLAVPYGLLLAFTDDVVWGIRRRPRYTLFARANQPFSAPERPQADFRKTDGRTSPPWRWSALLDLRPRALVRAGDVLVVAGAPKEYDPTDPYAAFEGRTKGLLWTVSAGAPRRLTTLSLPSPPVWDGVAAAHGRLYLSTVSGQVRCLTGAPRARSAPVALPPAMTAGKPGAGKPGAGKPGPKGTPGKPVTADRQGRFTLTPAAAETTGDLRYQPDRNNLGGWTNPADYCRWRLRDVAAGKYAVEFTYGSTNPGVRFTLTAGSAQQAGKTHDTGGIKTYETFPLGVMDLPAGNVVVTLKPGPFHGAIMNFRLLVFRPVSSGR